MNIAILGYGDQGRAARDYWNGPEYTLTICDQNRNLSMPDDVHLQLGEDYLHGLDQFDLIVRSPSVHPRDIVAANGPDIVAKVTSVTNEFMRVCPTKNIIGVTGTKGKGTTSSLIANMLKATGHRVHLGGNIGVPPLDMLQNNIQPDDWVVLELANFQLIDLQHSPHLAVCLMVVPEHLNWHANFEEYVAAKSQLFIHQSTDDVAVYFAKNEVSEQIAAGGSGRKIPYFAAPGAHIENDAIVIDGQIVCPTAELKLLGKHNWQNACAAVTAVWEITQDVAALRSVLTSFSGLEHRLELVREVDGVRYYDDSFGTAPATAIVALQAFTEPKVVILGGSDKEADYTELAQTVASSNVRSVVLIGKTAPKIKAALDAVGFTSVQTGGSNMPAIVQTARTAAQPGDVVLLSTACASFDMFANYKDRGEQFKRAVKQLA
jgi:UDP-N-acetylmuramoylalanine--D-glutamate ligase